MEPQAKRRGHAGLIVLLVVIVLLALVCAAPFVYNALTHFAYADGTAPAGGQEELFTLSAAEDGEHLLFHMDQSGIYGLMLENDVLAAAEAETGGKVRIEKIGYAFRAEQSELELRAAVKVFGFLPAQLRAVADVAVTDAQTLKIVPREVWYGNSIRIGPERLAKWTGMAELTDGFTVSLEDYAEPLRADALRLEDGGITLCSPLLAQVIGDVAAQDETVIRLLRLYDGDSDAAARALSGDGRAAYIRAAGASYAALRAALRDVCAYGTDAYRCALSNELSTLPFDLSSALNEFPALRQAQLARLAELQRTYYEAQTELRHAYWYKNVILSKAYLLDADGAPLEQRLPEQWEARIVLQYNENYDAIVKTSEGNPRLQVPIPGLPMMSELPRASWDALPPEGDGPFDLTLALRLPSGTPAVVFLTAEDEFGLAVISEELFAELRESERLPIRSSQEIAAAPRSTWLRLTGLGDGLPVGNYIGLS